MTRPAIPLSRLLLNVAVALVALLLTHVFLVRVPNYLVARSPRDAESARLVAPDVPASVEAPWRSTAGAGGGAVPPRVPAAPDRD